MSFAGGLFGAVIGAFVAGPFGALIGGGLGFLLTGSSSAAREREQARNQTLVWMEQFFRCLGKLAKSDGRVSEDEVAFVKSLLKEWKLPQEIRQQMIACFNEGRDSAQSFETLAAELKGSIPRAPGANQLRHGLTTLFCVLVAVDRVADPNEVEMLKKAGKILGSEEVVNEFFARTGGSSGSSREVVVLDECYKVLEISPDATDDEVKKAYRKKAVKLHPDKVQGAGLSDDQIQAAKVRFQELTNAYDTIRKHRGMK